MPTRPSPDTDHLLEAVSRGDSAARGQLLERHRPKLRRMVAVRLDRRLAARVDPSDVVQEAMAEAAARLDEYVRDRPLPFYPWLRCIVSDRLADASRRHLHARRRSVGREEPPGLPGESVVALAEAPACRQQWSERTAATTGAARPGAGGPGGAARTRSRRARAALPGGSVNRRGRGGPGR